jgi:GGDEF domain-containing protein
MERALLAARTSAYHRRHGETEDAVDAARVGLSLLARLRDSRMEGGRAFALLSLELVGALLDDGQLAEAEHAADPVLARPVRTAAAPSVGRLLLAIATRVLLPSGRVEAGRGLLDHAEWIAERHGIDWLLADALTTRADLEERAAKPVEALHALRSAHAAEHRRRRSIDAAKRRLVIEFGLGEPAVDLVSSLLRNVVRAPIGVAPLARSTQPASGAPGEAPQAKPDPPETDAATGLLTREGLSRRLRAVRRADRPVALTLVRLEPVDAAGRAADTPASPTARPPSDAGSPTAAPDALATLAGRVRDIAPEDAELARSDGSELAVLLPHTTRDQAEEFAATIRESAIESDWLAEASISTGVAQSDADPATEDDADSLLTAARETLTTAERDRPEPEPAEPDRVGPEHDRAEGDRADGDGAEHPTEPDPAGHEGTGSGRVEPDPTERDRVGLSAADLTAEESFLTGLAASTGGPSDASGGASEVAAESDPDTGNQAIRHLLAPLLDHPTLLHGARSEPEQAAEVPEPDEPDEAVEAPRPPELTPWRAEAAPAGDEKREPGISTLWGMLRRNLPVASEREEPTPSSWYGDPVVPQPEPPRLSDAAASAEPEPRYDDPAVLEPPRLADVRDSEPDAVPEPPEVPGSPVLPWHTESRDVAEGAPAPEPAARYAEPVVPEPEEEPEPPGRPDVPGTERTWPRITVPEIPEPDEVPEPPTRRPTPEEPGEVPRPPYRPDIIIPEEPDQIPPIPPGPEPTPDVPPPARIPERDPDSDPTPEVPPPTRHSPEHEPPGDPYTDLPPPDRHEPAGDRYADVSSPASLSPGDEPQGDRYPQASRDRFPRRDADTGSYRTVSVERFPRARYPGSEAPTKRFPPASPPHVESRVPARGGDSLGSRPTRRPPDPARMDRPTRRRDRSDTTSIADLLTEALVAYQATAPDEQDQPPAPDPVPDNSQPARRAQSGRHRLPDWASTEPDAR